MDTEAIEVVNLAQKFSLFGEYWTPKIAGELNDAYLKLAKLKGEFVWHQHDAEDELFLVVKDDCSSSYAVATSGSTKASSSSSRVESNIARWRRKRRMSFCWSQRAPGIQAMS